MSEKKKVEKKPVYECPYMRVVKCYRQDIKKSLDTSICIACVLGRVEKHMFTLTTEKSTKNDKHSR